MNPPLPLLGRALVHSGHVSGRDDLVAPTPAMLELPERAIQFGTGRFLRGFVSVFLDVANHQGLFGGRSVMVSSKSRERVEALNAQDGLFTVIARGVENGEPAWERRVVGSVSRALAAEDRWSDVLHCARGTDLEVIFSNTTEAGIRLDPRDQPEPGPPRSFPGKLACVLRARAQAFDYDPGKGVVVVPCELIEGNGDHLRRIVVELSTRWRFEDRFVEWLDSAVVFTNTLVDRIVPGAPAALERAGMESSLGYRDPMLTTSELFRLFVIEGDERVRDRLGFTESDKGIVVAPDLGSYHERKLRLLNGAHTAVVPIALLCGHETVRDAVEDVRMGRLLRRILFEEIAPFLGTAGAAEYAGEVIDRFLNPFIRHELIDITLQATTKMRVRVIPSVLRYAERTGVCPSSIGLGFAAFLLFKRGRIRERRRAMGLSVPPDDGGEPIERLWRAVDRGELDLGGLVREVCGDHTLWGVDLGSVPGFPEAVTEHLDRAVSEGPSEALEAHLNDLTT